MNRKEIIKMAREALGEYLGGLSLLELEHFAAVVAAAEREACARVLDANACKCHTIAGPILEANASAIRARGTP